MSSRRWLAAWTVVASLGVASSSWGQPVEPAADELRLSGFGTLGISRASAPPGWGFQRESPQPGNSGGTRLDTDSRLGLQANYALDPRLELVGQLLLKPRDSTAAASDAVAWAFAAYRPTDGMTVRAGRMSVNLFQLSDYRSVGLAYPFARPPTEFYSVQSDSFDGVDLSQSWSDGSDARWKLSGSYGKTKQKTNVSAFQTVSPLFGLRLSREEQGLLLTASFARATLSSGVAEAAPLVAGLQSLTGLPVTAVASDAAELQRSFQAGQTANYFGVGFNLERNDWLVTAEASRAILPGLLRLDSGYVLLGHHWGAVTPYLTVSAVRHIAQRDGPQWKAALTPVIGADAAASAQGLGDAAFTAATSGPTQRTLTLGVRYDLTAQSALKFQYDHSRIGTRGALLWSNSSAQPAAAHVLTATLDFVF